MKKLLFTSCLLLLAATSFNSCSIKDEDDPPVIQEEEEGEGKILVNLIPEKKPIVLTEQQKSYAESCNNFSFDLFRQSNEEVKSRVLSPLSVAYVLGMLNDGAEGETSTQIMSALRFSGADKTAINEFCRKLIEEAPEADPNVKLNIANALFVNKQIELLKPFQQDMTDYYHAMSQSIDFGSPDAVNIINAWCNEQTDGMIPEIMKETKSEIMLCLLNAIYFKAEWTDKFDPDDAKDTPFTGEDGSVQTMKMMNRQAWAMADFTTEDDEQNADILCLPYSSGAFCMYVLLPHEGVSTAEVINNLTAGSFKNMKAQMRSQKVDIRIPRFNTKSDIDLIPQLMQLGITVAFSDRAMFPYISNWPLFVSKMKQSAAIEVNEEGTKAAAVTMAEMNLTSAGDFETPVPFWTTRPFVYVIQETTSDVIFFVGTYMGD